MRSAVALSAGFIAGASAFWRMECPGRVALGRLDPIVNPGDISGHVHSISGSSGFHANATCPELEAAGCTSCRVKEDMSSYWHPALYFRHANGKYELVEQTGGMLAYYLLYGDNIKAFPSGFRMLSGDTERREYTLGDPDKPDPPKGEWASRGQTTQAALAQRAVGFNCLNYGRKPEDTLYRHKLPDKSFIDGNCPQGLRFEMMFPSCWKGGDEIDSENHMDHVAYSDTVMGGNCPDTHPVRLPSLLYEVIWNTHAFAGKDGEFVLSNNDTTGFGYHADFMTGWNEKFLQRAVNKCTNLSGKITDCPLFTVTSEDEARSCNKMEKPLPEALEKENCEGPMDRLPGGGGQYHGSGSPLHGSAPKVHVSVDKSHKSKDYTPPPGQVFQEKEAANAVKKVAAVAAPNPQPTPAPVVPAAEGAKDDADYYSTTYVTHGNVVTKILLKAETVYSTKTVDETVTARSTDAAHYRRHRAAHLHAHAHRKRKF